ncbi:OmpA/MotB domain protein [Paraburkholderia atlantica]|uniref:OmpA/MotB domain protein n=1 Tax=Paraburkholderia atlantica TaxID=2654982 RepID=D5WBV2_PARAM|nr:OmpA family protein [Paraburkholderia atlantica]ADG16480.1 OmpA/MotB domain protein [Paraburkholderia atlantica]
MTFNQTLKRALAGALLVMAGILPAVAQQTFSNQPPLATQVGAPVTGSMSGAGTQPGKVFGQTYAPLGQVSSQQAQVVYYRDASAGAGRSAAADVYVDGDLHTALLPGGYSIFCVKPGEHTLGAYIHDAPLYKGKTTGGSRAELKGGMTYFVKVAPVDSNGAPVVVPRNEAETQLQGMRAQMHVLSRASAVQACDYPSVPVVQPAAAAQPAVVKNYTLKGDTLFAFGKSGSRDMTGKGQAEISRLAEKILAENASLEAVTVIGHADLIGSDAAAQKLGEQRAMTVRRMLIEQGVPTLKITAESAGNSDPVVAECSGTMQRKIACNEPNRRVVVRVNLSHPA